MDETLTNNRFRADVPTPSPGRRTSKPPLGASSFRALVHYERDRSDRSGREFSLLCFKSREVPQVGTPLNKVASILADRLRRIDELGWLANDNLAVLLPYTPTTGAWKVADDVIASLSTDSVPPLCEVYTYPDNWLKPEESPISEQDVNDDEPPHRSYPVSFAQPLPFWKRAIDFVAATLGLIFLAPLFVAIGLLVKLSSPGPVFFPQRRTGLGGCHFKMLKFRTMVVGAETQRETLLALNEQDGPAFKIKRDPRVTPLGRLLRRTSLDELPQLWNVLKGEMSLVGPRPLPTFEVDACHTWQRRRHDVTPGLTCLWQVSGRCNVPFDEWMRMDLTYVRNRSIWLDLAVLCRTIPAVLFGHGAN